MFKVDGNSTKQQGKYLEWRVMDDKNNIICTFYGPMSASAAATFVREVNNNNHCNPMEAVKSKNNY
jgi:hypothetical protein